ncbi:hypothetical protein OE88DRAFT_1654079 [Heliocybe sulcata]|uniref:Uncharacterized protein n=1 Tax=Heliocybe sulcata TaxID=5364 RepID=A0A5C3ND62_9AGAM|nr:hypothetical protein OE88DRAFT_1654079 [Heliocybe sulcata]
MIFGYPPRLGTSKITILGLCALLEHTPRLRKLRIAVDARVDVRYPFPRAILDSPNHGMETAGFGVSPISNLAPVAELLFYMFPCFKVFVGGSDENWVEVSKLVEAFQRVRAMERGRSMPESSSAPPMLEP